MAITNKNALVTGASSGIGAATSLLLANEGFNVIMSARRSDRLLSLKREIEAKGGRGDIFPADLSRPENCLSIFEKIKNKYNSLDLLVNNAGVGWYGYFSRMPLEIASEMLSLNVSASMALTRLFLPGMLERKQGHIINIGSIAGGFPNQGVAVYSATKAFLDAFTSSLFREIQGSPVRISIIRAGPVLTEFCEVAENRKGGGRLPTHKVGISAQEIARQISKTIKRPKKVIYIPAILRFTPLLELCFGWIIDRLGPLLLKKGKI